MENCWNCGVLRKVWNLKLDVIEIDDKYKVIKTNGCADGMCCPKYECIGNCVYILPCGHEVETKIDEINYDSDINYEDKNVQTKEQWENMFITNSLKNNNPERKPNFPSSEPKVPVNCDKCNETWYVIFYWNGISMKEHNRRYG